MSDYTVKIKMICWSFFHNKNILSSFFFKLMSLHCCTSLVKVQPCIVSFRHSSAKIPFCVSRLTNCLCTVRFCISSFLLFISTVRLCVSRVQPSIFKVQPRVSRLLLSVSRFPPCLCTNQPLLEILT